MDDKLKGGSGGGQCDREKVRGCDRKREGGRKRDENEEKTGREEQMTQRQGEDERR